MLINLLFLAILPYINCESYYVEMNELAIPCGGGCNKAELDIWFDIHSSMEKDAEGYFYYKPGTTYEKVTLYSKYEKTVNVTQSHQYDNGTWIEDDKSTMDLKAETKEELQCDKIESPIEGVEKFTIKVQVEDCTKCINYKQNVKQSSKRRNSNNQIPKFKIFNS